MSTRLTRGIISSIFEGNLSFEKPPILQVLMISPADDNNRHSVIVSDGQWSHVSIFESTLSRRIETGEITRWCIFQFKKFAISETHRHIVFLGLTVLKSGSQIGRQYGNPQEFIITNTKNVIQLYKPPTEQPPVALTTGIIAEIFQGTIPTKPPVLQITHMQVHPRGKEDIYSVVLSDGQWSVKDVVLNPKVLKGRTNQVENFQMFTSNCIVQLNNFGVYEGNMFLITGMSVLHSGADLGQIGDPQPFGTSCTEPTPLTQISGSLCDSAPGPITEVIEKNIFYNDEICIISDKNIASIRPKVPHWLKTFEKRGVYIKESTPGDGSHIWYNDIKNEQSFIANNLSIPYMDSNG